jgi:hypothetical protein
MDPKGKGMVINDKEKETLYVDEAKGDKPTNLGSSHKKSDGKKKRSIKKIIYYDSDASSSSPRDDFDYSRIPYNSNAHLLSISLDKPLTLMEKTIPFRAIKCVVIYFLSILVFGKLWKMECKLTVVTILY